MLNIDYLHDFVTLAEVGKFNEAAELLFISQSSLSKHIAALEKSLDVLLFNRTTHNVELTKCGMALLPYARKMVNLRADMDRELLLQKNEGKKPQIIIGNSPIVPLKWFSHIIVEFIEKYNCKLNIESYDPPKLYAMLLQSKLDCMIAYDNGQFTAPELEFIPYASDRLAAVLPASHKLAAQSSIRLDELQNEKFVQVGSTPIMENFVSPAQGIHSVFSPDVDYLVDTTQQMLNFIRTGLAVTLMTEHAVQHFSDLDISVVPITPEIHCHVNMYFIRSSTVRREADNLFTFFQARQKYGLT